MQITAIQTSKYSSQICLHKTLKWCKQYEIQSIINCLEEFCNESFPEEWNPQFMVSHIIIQSIRLPFRNM
ncbi:unnamed protein product [Brugia pahangi]|uniref:Uncharacterized protein n=1 Tax=Brugia pahangi TaxID=6280 RepID=A0A0N4TYD4_BRUPA|nr:unnamed protein product [Brugia pahangi]